jgi:hypothetical protein
MMRVLSGCMLRLVNFEVEGMKLQSGGVNVLTFALRKSLTPVPLNWRSSKFDADLTIIYNWVEL